MRDDQEAGNDGEEGIIKKKKMIISLHYLVRRGCLRKTSKLVSTKQITERLP